MANLMMVFAVPDYGFEEEASEFVNSVHIDGDDEVEDYSGEDQQPQQLDFESETELEETPAEDLSALLHKVVEAEPEPVHSVEEPVGEPPKLTYASIVCTFFHFLHVLCVGYFKRLNTIVALHASMVLNRFNCLDIVGFLRSQAIMVYLSPVNFFKKFNRAPVAVHRLYIVEPKHLCTYACM